MASSLVAHHITVVHTKTCPFAQLKDINRDDDRDLGVQGEAKYKLLSIYEESRREKPQAEVSFVVETLLQKTPNPHFQESTSTSASILFTKGLTCFLLHGLYFIYENNRSRISKKSQILFPPS
jgi:hypothetical protein